MQLVFREIAARNFTDNFSRPAPELTVQLAKKNKYILNRIHSC